MTKTDKAAQLSEEARGTLSTEELRVAFEAMMKAPPYEWCSENLYRYPQSEEQAWPGQYSAVDVQTAFECFVAGYRLHKGKE